ncbi:hypothetical protein [Nitrospira sp. BLG_2]|uniref:hypothetical protein n=1 Tax=Nitrospira sp. BLG_2 TaxID=3397507 RepID=UPI003B9B7EFF
MDRELMIEYCVGDLQDWLKRDPGSFWEHIAELERSHLNSLSDGELLGVYQETLP